MKCSFCSAEQVEVLISNGGTVTICDQCVNTAIGVLVAFKFQDELTEAAENPVQDIADIVVRLHELAHALVNGNKRSSTYRANAREFYRQLTPELFLVLAEVLRAQVLQMEARDDAHATGTN